MNAFKVILCTAILFASVWIGFRLSSRLYKREKLLSDFILMLDSAGGRIAYTAESLASLFSGGFHGWVFKEDEPFAPQWQAMLNQYKGYLTPSDVELLAEFASKLGDGDAQMQQGCITMYSSMLSTRLQDCRRDNEQRARLYRILPFCAGLALSILII